MKRKITCFCDHVFEVDVPERIDVDEEPDYFKQIQDGTFFNFPCSGCGKKHKPEFPISVFWPSKKLQFNVVPELERGEFYRQKKTAEGENSLTLESIVGYPELADRLAVIRDGFEPVAIEAIKYFLHLKAEEQYPDEEIDIWYNSCSGKGDSTEGAVTFHVHGIRKNEVAVMNVPLTVYQKTLNDYKSNPKSDTFSSLRIRSYLSVKNTMRPEAFT